jgi:peptide/nickel transport system ATP-binding protein
MGSLPRLDVTVDRLVQIPGQPPSLLRPPKGCRFNPRCTYAMSVCREKEPLLTELPDDPSHAQACHLDAATKEREAAALLRGVTGGVVA